MPSESTPIQARTVFRQSAAPADTGALWLDTNTSPPTLKQYNSNNSSWEPVASSAVTAQDSTPSSSEEGDIWVDTSVNPPDLYVYDGSAFNLENPKETEQNTDTHAEAAILDIGNTDKQYKPFHLANGGRYEIYDADGSTSDITIEFSDGTSINDSVTNGTSSGSFQAKGYIVYIDAGATGYSGGSSYAKVWINPPKVDHTHNI
jgi:hypothetical protein